MPTDLAPLAARGVARAIEILRTDLIRTLKLLGCASTAELDRSFVRCPSGLARVGPSGARQTSITRWSIIAPITRKHLEAERDRDLSPFRSRLAQAVL